MHLSRWTYANRMFRPKSVPTLTESTARWY